MKSTLDKAAKAGRFGDDQLIHVSRHEIKGLEAMLPPGVNELPRNPDTGLKEAFFFLPLLLGAAAAAPAAAAAAPLAAGLGAAAATGLGAAGAAALPAAATAASGLGALGATGAAALPAAATALPAAATALPAATSGLGAALPAAAVNTSPLTVGTAGAAAPLASTPAALGGAAPGAISMPAAAASPILPATAPIPTVGGTSFGGSAATAAGSVAPATAFGGSAATATGGAAHAGGLGGLMGGLSTNQLMSGLGLMSLMGKMGGGGSSSGDGKKKDVSKDKYNGGSPVFPSDGGASGGTGPEWNYFPNSNFYANGGVVKMAEGGKVPSAKAGDQSLIKETVAALQGQAADPQQIIARFIKAFGQQALSDLMSKLKGGQGGSQQAAAPASGLGALQGGGGDGTSDSIPATISGQDGSQQPAALSEGEYVVPADAVSGLGNGSTDAGSRALDDMVGNVRQMKTGGKVQPPSLKASHVTGYAEGGPVGAPGGAAFSQGLGSFNAGFNGLAARMAGGMGQGPAMNTGLGAPMGQAQAGQWSGQMVRPAPMAPQPVYTPPPQAAPVVQTPMQKLTQLFSGFNGGNGGGARGASSGGNGNGWGGH